MKKKVVLDIFIVFIIFFFSLSLLVLAASPNERIMPVTPDNVSQWQAVGGSCTAGTHFDCVDDDPTDDGETSFVECDANALVYDFFNTNASFVQGTHDIKNVTVYTRRCSEDGSKAQASAVCVNISGTSYCDTGISLTNTCPTYATQSWFLDDNPATAGEWTVAEVNEMLIGASAGVDCNPDVHMTQVYAEVGWEDISEDVTRQVSENYALTEMLNISQELSRKLSDSLSYNDMVNTTKTISRNISDSMSYTDMVNTTVTTIVIRPVNDPIGTYNDMVNISQELSRKPTESLTYSEMTNISQELSRNVSDNLGTFTEDVTRTVITGVERQVNDPIGTYNDMTNISQELSRNISDSLSYSEMINTSQDISRNISDNFAYTDMVNITQELSRNVSDNFVFSDMVNTTQDLSRNVSDNFVYSDTVNLTQILSRNVSESLTWGETVDRSIETPGLEEREVSDNFAYTDMVNISQILSRKVSDNFVFNDMINTSQTLSRKVSDNFVYTDMVNITQSLSRQPSESFSYTDMINTTQELSWDVSDNFAFDEMINTSQELSRSVTDDFGTLTEMINTSQELSRSVTDDFRTLTEMINISQELSRNISDSMTYNENVIRSVKILGVEERSVTEQLTYSEMTNISQELSRKLSDSLSYNDMANTTKTISRNVSDSATYSDMINISQEVTRNVSDTMTYSEMINTSQDLSRNPSDFMTYSEMLNTSKIMSRNPSDSATLVDMVNTTKTLTRNATESINYQDIVNISQILLRNISDSMTYQDSVTSKILGYLEMELVEPIGLLVKRAGESFTLNATITCREKNCGEINATPRYDENVISTSGVLYVDNVLRNCTLNQDQTCYVNWTVYTTSSGSWKIDVNASPYANDTEDAILSVYTIEGPGPTTYYTAGPYPIPLLDLVITDLTPVVFAGENIYYAMELTNIGKITTFDVIIYKRILKDDTILIEETMTKAMRDKVMIEDFVGIPEYFNPGTYFLELVVEYEGKSIKAVATFDVKKDCLIMKSGSFDIFRQKRVIRPNELRDVTIEFDNICNMPLTGPIIHLDSIEMKLDTISVEGTSLTFDFDRYGLYKAEIYYNEGFSKIEFYVEGLGYDLFPIALLAVIIVLGILGYKFIYPVYIKPLFPIRKYIKPLFVAPKELEMFMRDLEIETIKALRRKFKKR